MTLTLEKHTWEDAGQADPRLPAEIIRREPEVRLFRTEPLPTPRRFYPDRDIEFSLYGDPGPTPLSKEEDTRLEAIRGEIAGY